MARRVWCALTVCAVLAIGQEASAQTLGEAAAAARKAPSLDPALRADIEKLMALTGATNLGVQMASQFADAFFKSFKDTQPNVPQRAIEIVQEVIITELSTAFSGPELKDGLIGLYAKYFTHAEIKGLIAFYESDLGRKAIANMPNLVREGGEIGQRWAQSAMPKIMQKLQDRLKAEGLVP
jgi:hypothetical protein